MQADDSVARQQRVPRLGSLGATKEVRSSCQNAVEHVSNLLAAVLQRLDAVPAEERLRLAVYQLHERTFQTFNVWLGQMGLSKTSETDMDATGKLHQLMLWYMIWGEAANLRHMPECLCLILYCMSDALHLQSPHQGAQRIGRGGARST